MIMKTIINIMHKSRMKILCFILPLLLAVVLASSLILHNGKSTDDTYYSCNVTANADPAKPRLSIIIDDFGQARDGVKEMMNIKRPLTFAVMPFLAFSNRDAIQAHESGHEVIIHLPMQAAGTENRSSLGPRPITVFSHEDEIKSILLDSFNTIPFAKGANIHMGSKASEDERVVSCIMELIKENDFYFVDSKTSSKSVCKQVADRLDIRFASRNVFLEHTSKAKDKIKKQLSLAGDIALKNGYAVAIGHVGSEGGKVTAESIEEMIPVLEQKGIEFVFASDLFID